MAEQIVLRDHALTASRAEAERLRALVDDAVDAWLGGVSADLEMPMRALEAALAGGKP